MGNVNFTWLFKNPGRQAASQVQQPLNTSMYRQLLNTFLSLKCNSQAAVCIIHTPPSHTHIRPLLNYQDYPGKVACVVAFTEINIRKLSFTLTLTLWRRCLAPSNTCPQRTGRSIVSLTWGAVALRWRLPGSPNLDKIFIGALKY